MIGTILLFVVVIGILVLVHEFGHFITARFFGVAVDEFGIGFPPRLFGIKKKNTLYSINAVPLGGFVKIKGELGDHAQEADSFSGKKAWQRLIILLAGVAMNFFLAFILLSVGFMIGMPQEIPDSVPSAKIANEKIVILEVEEGSPASTAGIRPGDALVSIDGQRPGTPNAVVEYIKAHSQENLVIVVKRGSHQATYQAKPQQYGTHERAILGISTIRSGTVRYGMFEAIARGASGTALLTWAVLSAFGGLLAGLFTGANLSGQVSGPVGVAVLTSQVAQLGFTYLLNFTAMLSVNLGILNSIPFPALDGGRALFVVLGRVKGRPVNPKVEGWFHNIGFALLILLVVIITYHDVAKYGQQILYGIKQLVN